jgi:hypothetical protein
MLTPRLAGAGSIYSFLDQAKRYNHPLTNIAREKELKGMEQAQEILIVSSNPEWKDLSEGWFGQSIELVSQIGSASRKVLTLKTRMDVHCGHEPNGSAVATN